MLPWDAEKLEKRIKNGSDASKEDPGKHPRPKMRPEKARRGLKEHAQDPHGAQEANQASKVLNSHRKIDGFKKKHQIPLVKQRIC